MGNARTSPNNSYRWDSYSNNKKENEIMFVRKSTFDDLKDRVRTLEMYARRDYDRLGSLSSEVKSLKEQVGTSQQYANDAFEFYYEALGEMVLLGRGGLPKLTLWQTIEGIMKALKLEVKQTPGTEAKAEVVQKAVKKK
jgi:hypothetical protein